jgi:thioredoxin 1
MLAPLFKQMEQDMPDITFETVDVDDDPEIALLYQVRSVPTVLISNSENDKILSLVGANSKVEYLNAIEAVRL